MDNADISPPPAPEYSADFVRRSRHGGILPVLACYPPLVLAVAAVIYLRGSFGSEALLYAAALAPVAIIAVHAFYTIQRNIDVITETEFQNALFSSSVARHADFCLIVRHDGHFAYADRGFSRVFPGFAILDRSLQNLLEAAGVARSDAERLYDAVKCRRRDWFMFVLTDAEGKTRQMILNLYPLPRPDGYFLIQGREMLERRGGAAQEEKTAKSIAGPTFRYMRYLFDEMPMGAYALSPGGQARVANRVLERWLGYGDGEIMDKELTFEDLLYKADGAESVDFLMKDYTGPVSLVRKNGSLFKAALEQHLVRDESGSTLAVIGILRENGGDT